MTSRIKNPCLRNKNTRLLELNIRSENPPRADLEKRLFWGR
jgi:hypothetical protein